MVSSKFECLSIRPPTPPKDLKDIDIQINDAIQLLDDPFGTKTLLKLALSDKALLNTPDSSPSSGTSVSSSSKKKRVNFELQGCCSGKSSDLIVQPWTPQKSSPLRPLPQTRISKPLKSILKPSDPASVPSLAEEGTAHHNFESFAEMLESMTKMLAQGARPSKLDAYITLQRTLQAYDKLPDTNELMNKMGLFEQFIRRDLQAIGINGTGPDIQLIQQALKFVMGLMRKLQDAKVSMDDDFCSFLIDHSISVSENAATPKAVVNHHLALLMQQNFRPRVMTVARVEKILDVLDAIHERVSGYSVQVYRIRVYRKLIQQRPEVMAKHTERWFKYVLKALLSGQKDTHTSALETAICAAKTVGSDPSVTKAILAIMNRVKSDGDTFGKAFAQELTKSLHSDSAALVPHVWGAITAFLGESLRAGTLTASPEWLQVFEDFFNSRAHTITSQANIAYAFMIYALDVDIHTPKAWSEILLNVSRSQFRRLREGKSVADAATSGYLTLIYYALRPSASHEQLTRYWGEFVTDFWIPIMTDSSPSCAIAACRFVSALLKGSRRPWNQHRALETKLQLMVQPQDLPLLDPRWVRKSIGKVLAFIETLLDATPWTLESADDEPVKTLWISLLDSLREASSKEVMITSETKNAIAQIVNMLRRLWDRHTAELAVSQQGEDLWADKFCFLLEMIIEKLGAFQFSDKCLSRNVQDEFEVAPTPSNRTRQNGARISPLLYFVDLVMVRSEMKLSDNLRIRLLMLVLERCLCSQGTRLAKLELLRDCCSVASSSSTNPVTANFWTQMASLAKVAIEEQPADPKDGTSRQLGQEYDLVVEILALASPHLPDYDHGPKLLSTFLDVVRKESGEGGVIFAVIEKTSAKILRDGELSCVPYITLLLRNLPSLKSQNIRHVVEDARQRFYSASTVAARGADFDPYNHFYTAVTSIGAALYSELDSERADPARNFLESLAESIRRCPNRLLGVYMRKTQDIIALWVEDAQKKLRVKEEYVKAIRTQIISLWQAVDSAVKLLPKKDSTLLAALEPLLCSGFVSRQRAVVNIAVCSWNATFGEQEALNYPARLQKALCRVKRVVELSTPSLGELDNVSDEPLLFDDSDDTITGVASRLPESPVVSSTLRVRRTPRLSRSPAVQSTVGKRSSTRKTRKVRLRHEDSQIQFEPVLSLPSNPLDQESQVLTERQKETLERQRASLGIFANMDSRPESQPTGTSTEQLHELHSDALSADELPTSISRSPLKSLASIGHMDVFLGSSPTPRSRNKSHPVRGNDALVAYPNTQRSVHITEGSEIGSSPPRFAKLITPHSNGASGQNTAVASTDGSDTRVFDDIITIDDDMFLNADSPAGQGNPSISERGDFSDEPEDKMPSSTIELQINAQLNAELQAAARSSHGLDVDEGSNNDHVHAEPQSFPDSLDASTGCKQSSDISRVDDSFCAAAEDKQLPDGIMSENTTVRRSTRLSGGESLPQASATKKRRQAAADPPRENKKAKQEDFADDEPQGDTEEDDFIVLAPAPKKITASKRKRSRSHSRTPSRLQTLVPETTQKPATRRRSLLQSASQLNDQENKEDEVVEDTPAPKRARKTTKQDVSEAKDTSPQTRVLRHVRVSPQNAASRASSVAADETLTITEAVALSSAGKQKVETTAQLEGDTAGPVQEPSSVVQPAATSNTPSRSFAKRVILTPRSILEKLQGFTSSIKQMVLGREEERELVGALFDLGTEIQAAGRRGEQGPGASA
ncbi:uncharacterized protein EI97DRAFT_421878 [Westerdykella ornata]|uniref:Telomere-associated protein Rif1 N-terminal domain-containing protein n=1 Tax=Westerdykella ornata TaxID=318751 RepID=A0A6A6JDL3_WESOR|nr:uncharacterized protein EI97DRAFT_421878 [Westerdykella ornata]KAF2274700.1 hypothetical protein EI97DRAFT_421878 [Westerdykella ornata]